LRLYRAKPAVEARRLYALAVYMFALAGELKQTKTGNKYIRRFAIEPNLMPLLRTMHAESNGVGAVVTMRQQKWWAADLRKHLKVANVKRVALFRNGASCKCLRFHACAASVSPGWPSAATTRSRSRSAWGHTAFDITQKYIRAAEAVGEVIGAVFPRCR
jgi:hypothetical protein